MKHSFKGLTALVVEDEWLLREDIVSNLQRDGWTVFEAATGAGALVTLREANSIDLLITDIKLADALTGWDVAEAFRKSNPQSPVIYASGNPVNNLRRVEESWFLNKPTSASEIIAAYRDLVSDGNKKSSI